MSLESQTFNESMEHISRDQVIDAYRKFSGAGDPARLDYNDPEVIKAEELLEKWDVQESAKTDEDSELRHNFDKTMLHVDAGFHDPKYLEEVLYEWLIANDIDDMPKDTENPARVSLRKDMAEAIKRIRNLLGSTQ